MGQCNAAETIRRTLLLSEYLVTPVAKRAEQLKLLESLHAGSGNSRNVKTTGGHLGSRSLTYSMQSKFFWPKMARDIKDLIRSCPQCQKKKDVKIQKVVQELNPVPIPFGKQWSQIGIDLMGLKEVHGYKYILTAIDYFTKWVEMAPLKQKSGEEVAFWLWQWTCRHGAADIHISDQGREFNNALSAELCALTGTKHRVTSAYHPQANGLVERANGHTTNMLRAAIEDQEDWLQLIPSIMCAHNNKIQQSTGFSPYHLMYGHPRRIPEEERRAFEQFTQDPSLSPEEIEKLQVLDSDEYQIAHFKALEATRERIFPKAESNNLHAQSVYKKHFDKKHRGKMTLDVGDKVLKRYMVNRSRQGGKLEANWNGPYIVTEVHEDKGLYKLAYSNGKELKRLVPSAQVKAWTSREEVGMQELDDTVEDEVFLTQECSQSSWGSKASEDNDNDYAPCDDYDVPVASGPRENIAELLGVQLKRDTV